MGASKRHSWLSPSAAHRWMACPGSRFWEAKYPDNAGEPARWGTAVHWVCACALEREVGTQEYVGVTEPETGLVIDREMAACAATYVDFVHQEYFTDASSDALRWIEGKVSFGPYVGVDDLDATGTLDFGVLLPEARELHVVDLKTSAYNRVYAWVEDERGVITPNPQLALYALGLYDIAVMLGHPVDKIVLRTVMPRIPADGTECWTSTHEITPGALQEFAIRVATSADAERTARKQLEEDDTLTTGLVAGGHCRYCKHFADCTAAQQSVEDVTATDLRAMVPETNALSANTFAYASGNALARRMNAVQWLEWWCKAVRGEVERRLLDNTPISGWKLVQGRAGNARFIPEEKAVAAVLKSMRLRKKDMYTMKLRSPRHILEQLSKTQRVRLATIIERPAGKVHVAPELDPRDTYTPVNADSAIQDLNEIGSTQEN